MLKPAGNAKARLYGVGAAASYYSWNWMIFFSCCWACRCLCCHCCWRQTERINYKFSRGAKSFGRPASAEGAFTSSSSFFSFSPLPLKGSEQGKGWQGPKGFEATRFESNSGSMKIQCGKICGNMSMTPIGLAIVDPYQDVIDSLADFRGTC